MAYNFLQSVKLMTDAVMSFEKNCLNGLEPRLENIKINVERSLMLVTALAPKIGYDKAAELAKKAHKNNTSLRDEALKSGYIDEIEYDHLVDPSKMI